MDQNTKNRYFENKEHTPYDFPYNTYVCSIPLDFSVVNPHWHNEVELIVIKKGRGIISVDLISYHVEAGDLLFICPGQLHSIRQEESYRMEYENILFKPELLKSSGVDYCSNAFLKPLLFGEVHPYPLIDPEASFHSQMLSLIGQIDLLSDKKPIAYQLAIKGCLFQILYLIISMNPEQSGQTVDQKSVEKIKTILNYVEQHYSSHITIEEIARHCSYSESYFMKFFKQHMGMGFIAYLNDYRLEKAADALLQTEEAILRISTENGFDNLSYFTRSFKKKYGITPGAYRRK